jgi:hypothetical protein
MMNTRETVPMCGDHPISDRYRVVMFVARRAPTIAAVAVAALIAASCGGSSDSSDSSAEPVPAETETDADADTETETDADTDTDTTAGDTAGDAADAPEILQFMSPLVGGGEIDASELADKPTAFWFWSPT